MKILYKGTLLAAILIVVISALVYFSPRSAKADPQTDSHSVTLDTTIGDYLNFGLSGNTLSLGALTPGSPQTGTDGIVATATTNASNGYTISISDGRVDPNSALKLGTENVYIPDYDDGTIGTPAAWTDGIGLGITMWDADTNPEAKWCADTCTGFADPDNKYAAIPETATVAHTSAGFKSGPDTSSWAWKVDVENTQKTGAYSGDVTFTATAVLS